MALVDSLLTAMVRADGDALVMHVGERPYMVVAAGTLDLSTQTLNIDGMTGMLQQLLPPAAQDSLAEFGAVEHRLSSMNTDAFTLVAARGGDDIWIEIRRRRNALAAAAAAPAAPVVAPVATPAPVAVEPAPEAEMVVSVAAPPAMEALAAEEPAPAEIEVMAQAEMMAPAEMEIPGEAEPAAAVEPLVEEELPAEVVPLPEVESLAEAAPPIEAVPAAAAAVLTTEEAPPIEEAPFVPPPVAEPAVVALVAEPIAIEPDIALLEELLWPPGVDEEDEAVTLIEAVAAASDVEMVASVAAPPPMDVLAAEEPPPEVVADEPLAPVAEPIAIEPDIALLEGLLWPRDVDEPAEEAPLPEPVAPTAPEAPAAPAAATAPAAPAAPAARAAPAAPELAPVLQMLRTVRIEVPARAAAPRVSGVERLLRLAASRSASVLYLTSDCRPSIRVESDVRPLDGEPSLTRAEVEAAVIEIVPAVAQEAVGRGESTEWITEFADLGRIRCLTFTDHRGPGVVFRMIATRAATAEQLGLPREVQALATEPQGLVLVAGTRGTGKSTLLSALVDLVNGQRAEYVITLEREIRLVHENRAALVSQREVRGGVDEALGAARAALREDPDVLVVDDLASAQMVPLLLQAAAEGLVFVSITAQSTTDAVERFVDLAPAELRAGVQAAMAETFRGAVAQVLLKKAGGGRVAAREVLLATAAVTRVISDGMPGQLQVALEGGHKYGMVSLADALVGLVQAGVVDVREAFRKSPDRARLLTGLKREGIDTSVVDRLA